MSKVIFRNMKRNNISERWVDVKGYEGVYQVSDMGRVKSLKFGKERILKATLDSLGYRIVGLCVNNVSKNMKVHRLVALHFIPNPKSKPQVNHKKGFRSDNRFHELEWATTQENIIHSYKELGKVSPYKGRTGSLACNAKQIKCENFDIIFPSSKEVSEFFGLIRSSISGYILGKRKAPYGLTFKYV